MERWMTLEETAEYLQISRSSAYHMVQKGKIPASKVGKLWRFKKEEIDTWMKNQRKEKLNEKMS